MGILPLPTAGDSAILPQTPVFDLSSHALQLIVVQMIILILSIAVHEFGHAFVADRLGDRLPRLQGRVTLNPLVHADPLGTIAFPLIFLLMSGGTSLGFGWGRPVQVNPVAFTRRFRMRTGHMFVAAAGPAMNLLFGLTISLILFLLLKTGTLTFGSRLTEGLFAAVGMNFILAFFNLIPAPPLDGGTVLKGLLPDRFQPAYAQYAQYGVFVVLLVVMSETVRQVFLWPATTLLDLLWSGLLLRLL